MDRPPVSKNCGELALGIGEAFWIMSPEGKYIGGGPVNFAYYAGQCGLNSLVASAMGDDELGCELMAGLEAKGLNYILAVTDYPTGAAQAALDEAGRPVYSIREDAAWDNIPLSPKLLELAARARCVSFGALGQRGAVSRATILAFLDAMPKDGEHYRVFNANLLHKFYGREMILESLRRANVLKLNDCELAIMSDMFGYADMDLRDKCRFILQKYSLKILMLTCGANGSYIFAQDMTSFLPNPVAPAADAAGDAFCAAFMAGILQGCPPGQAHANAAAISAFVRSQPELMPPIPDELKTWVKG